MFVDLSLYHNIVCVYVRAESLGTSPSCLGSRLHLDGDSVMSANMGYVRGACREESRDGGWGQAGESSVVLLAIR